MELSEQLKLYFPAPASQKLVTQTELNVMIGQDVVENMLPLSTVDSDSFRGIIGKIPGRNECQVQKEQEEKKVTQ